MSPILAASLAVVHLATAASSGQAKSAPAGNPNRINACTFLTREVVTKIAPPPNKFVLDIPPREEPIGANGSACNYASIGLQIDPFPKADALRKSPRKDWQPVSGVGDTAFFHPNRTYFAELIVWSGTHHFTIQMSVPSGSTPDKEKPKTIELARTIIAKLK